MADSDPPQRTRASSRGARPGERFGAAIAALAALICGLVVATLRDVGPLVLPPLVAAPLLVESGARGDAALRARVRDEAGQILPEARVRVFVVIADRAHFAGDHRVDAAGEASFDALPRGEAWVLAYDAGRARASTRVLLEPGSRSIELVLRPAKVLDVVVVDDADRAIEGADLTLRTGDPLPFVARTEAGGTARFDRLGPPPYAIHASAPGFEDTTRTGLAPGPLPLRLRLDRLGGLTVRVVRAGGGPVEGATVLAAGTGLWPAQSTLTDASGAARISRLKSGVYDLKARLGAEVSPTAFAVPVKQGEAKEVELVLQPGRRVRVTVTDGEGAQAPPVAGASVVLAEHGLSSFPLHGRTDAAGIVELGPIAEGHATASASAPGFVPRSARELGALETELRIPLSRGGALVGEVVDDRGFPVAGASIEVVGVDTDGMPLHETTAMAEFREQHFARSLAGPAPLLPIGELGVMPGPLPDLPRGDAPLLALRPSAGEPWVSRLDGRFRAAPVSPGRVQVLVRHPDYVEGTSPTLTLTAGGEAKVRIVLRQGGLLEGRVLEEDRRPVAGARVELSATEGSLERIAYAADDGTFAFAAVPGEVMLSVSRPGSPADVAARLLVAVPDRERKEIEVVLPKPRDPVAIHVTDDRGYPLDRVELRAISLDVEVPLRRTLFTDAAGDASLPDAVGLPLRLTLLRPSKSPRVEELESAPASLSLVLSEGVRGEGTVTARGGRERVEGAEVALFTASGIRRTHTNAEGAFRFEDLAPGRARLTARREGLVAAELILTVRGDRDHPADLGRIDLAEAGEVEGEVVDERDRPVAGARVGEGGVPTFLPLGPLPPGLATTDREGHFRLGGLAEGEAVIEAYSAEHGRGAVEGVPVRAGATTPRLLIRLPGAPARPEEKSAGSVAVSLAERSEGGQKAVLVRMVPPGSEAELAGIEPGDRLLAVNGHAVGSIEEARRRLSGPLAEDVVLRMAREGEPGPRLLRIQRERVRR